MISAGLMSSSNDSVLNLFGAITDRVMDTVKFADEICNDGLLNLVELSQFSQHSSRSNAGYLLARMSEAASCRRIFNLSSPMKLPVEVILPRGFGGISD